MNRAALAGVFLAVLASLAVSHAAPQAASPAAAAVPAKKQLKDELFEPGSTVSYNPLQKKVEVEALMDTRLRGNTLGSLGNPNLVQPAGSQGQVRTARTDVRGQVIQAQQVVTANYPDPVLQNPNGWLVGARARSDMIIASSADSDVVKVVNAAISNTKLAPSIAIANTNTLTVRPTFAYTTAYAYARPGLQYGVTLASADQQMVNMNNVLFQGPNDESSGVVRAHAQAGQGQTVALGRNVMRASVGDTVSDVRADATSSRWYMSPGHAVAGAVNVGNAGRVRQYTENQARAEQGSATTGVLNYGVATGINPFTFFNVVNNNIFSEIDNRATVDAGAATAGFLNIQRAYGGRVALRNFPGATAAAAVGNSAAGGIAIGYSETGKVLIGDYDQENDSPENDVAATTRGRGTAEAGLITIAIAPNDAAQVLGDVRSTATQGSSAAGAFSLSNAYETAEMGIDVNARTAEYNAVAVNVGVANAAERAVIANSATARTTTGSALALNEANAAVATQTSSTASSDSSTTTGQSASVALAQGVGGVHSDSQGAASASTATGNALSVGGAFSGAIYTTRAVSTSAATSKEGQSVSASWSGAVSGDTTADTAASAATTVGNAGAVAQGYSLGAVQGKATVAASSGSEEGSAGSLAVGVSTGMIQAQSRVASSAETKDGRAQSLAGSLAAAGINSISSATSSGASETGDVTSTSVSLALGAVHGEAVATSSASTGCIDCVSDSVANAVATGVIADSLARSAADSDRNPGNALANAISVGLISRTSNGGSSRIAVGPAQAISGGFAVSASKKVQSRMASAAAVNPASRRTLVDRAVKEHQS